MSIVWHGLPAYAARLMRSVTALEGIDVSLFATGVPSHKRDAEAIAGRPITWLTPQSVRQHAEAARPDICFVTGWAFSACNNFAKVARARRSALVSMVDNRYRGDFRQTVGARYFRLFLRKQFDLTWVPGESARRLCIAFGMPPARIATGLYGGDPDLFRPPDNVERRPARIGFVGQMIARKGVDLLLAAFQRQATMSPGYELHLYGDGPLASLCRNAPHVIHHPFADSRQIADALRTFRVFAMPSRDDNWPLALHEAALSGCALLTTDAVGNAEELVTDANGLVVRSGDTLAIADALHTLCGWTPDRFSMAAAESRKRAEVFGPERWRREFLAICDALAGR